MKLKLSAAALALSAALVPADVSAQDPAACWLRGATADEAMERASPLGVVGVEMAGETLQICYARPSARGRQVMGALVPFGQIWRVGANEATQVHLPFDAQIGGEDVPAGVYSLYAIPGEDEWEFFLNSNYQRWGVPVDAGVRATEVASFTRSVSETEDFVETFTISYDQHGAMMGHLVLEWENTHVEIPVHHGSMSH
jgi:hypothetical protein